MQNGSSMWLGIGMPGQAAMPLKLEQQKRKKRKEILAQTDDQNSTSTYWLFGRVELGVIDASTLRMSPAPFHPVDDDFKRDAQVQDYVHWFLTLQGFRLLNCSWKSWKTNNCFKFWALFDAVFTP